MQQALSVGCRRVTRATTLWHSVAHKSSVSVRARAQRVPRRVLSSGVRARGSVSVSPRFLSRCARASARSHGWRRHGSARAAVRADFGEFTLKFPAQLRERSVHLTVFRARASVSVSVCLRGILCLFVCLFACLQIPPSVRARALLEHGHL